MVNKLLLFITVILLGCRMNMFPRFAKFQSRIIYLYNFCRVLDNLKDYAIRALVNAVDHIGTVAYKLTDLVDQQTLEISSTELHVTCLHQVRYILIFLLRGL